MTFAESIRSVYRTNYANFRGRASRSEYWWITLFNLLVMVGGMLLMHLLFYLYGEKGFNTALVFYVLFLLYALIPGIAVTIRRLHDAGLSGWLALVCLVPWLGGIVLLVLMLLPSGKDNRYGSKDFKAREIASKTSKSLDAIKITKMPQNLEQIWQHSCTFHAQQYEIWANGECKETGDCNITANITLDGITRQLEVQIEGSTIVSLKPSFKIALEDSAILEDRIQYGSQPEVFKSSPIPFICNIFSDMKQIRFALYNEELKLIELYGKFT